MPFMNKLECRNLKSKKTKRGEVTVNSKDEKSYKIFVPITSKNSASVRLHSFRNILAGINK